MKMRISPILAALAMAAPAVAQPTAFTYQGLLRGGGQPVTGAHDFQFRLFDAAGGGLQLGPTICLDNVPVANGVFTTTLDFGQQYATSASRYLEIQVRADTGLDCSNGSGMVVLGPRQRLTPAPLAAHAHGAQVLDAPNGSRPAAVFLDDAGRVGVGTVTPQATLHLVRAPGEGLRIQGPAAGNANTAIVTFLDAAGSRNGLVGDASVSDNTVYLVSDTGSVHLAPAGAPTLTVSSGSRVGVGSASPAVQLDVRGDIRLGPVGQFNAAAGEENLRIIRGVIHSTGAIISGAGFTVTRTEAGKCQITFSPAFSGAPAITATVADSGPTEAFPYLEFAGSGGVVLESCERDTGDFVDRTIQFMAVGPR